MTLHFVEIVKAQIDPMARVQVCLDAANRLIQKGHVIDKLLPDASSTEPVIWVRPNPTLAMLVERGHATYNVQGVDRQGAYREGYYRYKWGTGPAQRVVLLRWRERRDRGTEWPIRTKEGKAAAKRLAKQLAREVA